MRDPRSDPITGARSGVGAALAEAYAAPGVALAPGGRDRERRNAAAVREPLLGRLAQKASAALDPH